MEAKSTTASARHDVARTQDTIQQGLTQYAAELDYDRLSPEAIYTAKVRVIDTLGALIGGFFGTSCSIARQVARQMPQAGGATVLGTRMKTTPEMAAFTNATTARYLEMMDVYHREGSAGGHPSDVVMPVIAAAEHARASGPALITAIVLAYETFLRISDAFHNSAFDPTNFCVLGTALAAGKLFGLAPEQLSHCISMAVVPNNILAQVRLGHLSTFKAAASGQAGRAGVFAALLARAGMQGPHLPFEGKAGWCDHVARERFPLPAMGGNGVPFKILETRLKRRPAAGETISSILAAEEIAPLGDVERVKRVVVEVYKRAKDWSGPQHWDPDSRETADHSIPYLVAAALIDGTVTARSFDDAHLWNPVLRALIRKIELVENDDFTKAYGFLPAEHRTRITVEKSGGERLLGESGGDDQDLSHPMTDAQIEQKFRMLSEECLGAKKAGSILDRLWNLDQAKDVGEIASALAFI